MLIQADSNRTSYRDLLSTAESIIEMDNKMQQTETLLEEMSKKCNARLLEKKTLNWHSWDEAIGATGIRNQEVD